jgi:hypothetical protein
MGIADRWRLMHVGFRIMENPWDSLSPLHMETGPLGRTNTSEIQHSTMEQGKQFFKLFGISESDVKYGRYYVP